MDHSPVTADELMTMSLPNNINSSNDPGEEMSSSPPRGDDGLSIHSSETSPPPNVELEKGLRILENRIQKISAPSHLPKPTKSLLPKPDLKIKVNKSVKLMNIPSPISEIGPPSNGGLSSSATAPTTSSMLKSTLKRMTRISTTKPPPPSSASPSQEQSIVSPKKRVPAKSPGPPLARSKSFKEPFSHRPSSSSSTSSTASNGSSKTMSSSLRRPARRDDSSATIQRSGTAGNLAKRSQSMRRLRDRDVLVKKSRGVQTQLTKDVMLDEEVEEGKESIHTAIDFSVYFPDILGCGNAVDPVETLVSEHTDPPDVRKNRQLTLDNMKLHREVERLKAQVSENEHLKRELKSVRSKLEEEQKARVNIERQLDEHNDKVQCIVRSMDTVEREFESRQDNMLQLESRCAEMHSQLLESQRVINEKRQELILKSNEYKTLLARFQEAELETSELQEFLQAEKTTLAEDLKESEAEIQDLKLLVADKELDCSKVEERCQHLVRLGEQRHQEILTLEAQLNTVQEKAKEMILSQGAEISRASIAFAQLSAKLEAFFNNFSNNNHFNNGVGVFKNGFPRQGSSFEDEDNSSASSNLSSPLRKHSVTIPRSASHFLVTPPNKEDFEDDEELVGSFNRAMMTVSLFGPSGGGSNGSIHNNNNNNNNNNNMDNNLNNNNPSSTANEGETSSLGLVNTSLQNLSNAIDQRKKSQESGGLSENSDISSPSSLPSLVDRICDITNLIDKYNLNLRNMSHCNCNQSNTTTEFKEAETESSSAPMNGNAHQDLNKIISEKESEIIELKKNVERMLKHREILQSNWKSTEAEVHEMDSLYQVTVENVLNVLRSNPELVNSNNDFLSLQKKMETAVSDGSEKGRSKEGGDGGTPKKTPLPNLKIPFRDPSSAEEDLNANQSL